MAEQKIKLLLVDDHTILRQGLRRILDAEPDMTVVGEARDRRRSCQACETAEA